MIRSWFSILFLFPIITFSQIKFTHFKTENGLPHDFTFQVFQDDDNYIWVGTDDGLAKFNGNEFKVLNHLDGFRTNYIIDLKKYNTDTIAVAVWKGGLHFMKNDSVLKPAIKNDSLTRTGELHVLGKDVFSSDNKGGYYLYEKQNGILFTKKKIVLQEDDQGNISLTIGENKIPTYNRSVAIDDKLYFYRGIFSWSSTKLLKGIYKYKEGKVKQTFSFFKNDYINSLGKYGIDTYYATINDRFYIFNTDSIIKEEKYNFNNGSIHKYAEASYCKVFVVNDKESGNDVIHIYDKKKDTWQILTDQIDSKILASGVFVDKDENIWITSKADGLYQLSKDADFIKESILDNNYIDDIAVGDKGAVFFLKQKHIYGYNYKTKKQDDQILKTDVGSFAQRKVENNKIFLASPGYEKEKETILDHEIYSTYKLTKKIGRVNFFYNESCFYGTNKNSQQSVNLCLKERLINDITIVGDELWIATNIGIRIYDLDSLEYKRKVNLEPGIKKNYIKQIDYDAEQGIWFVSSDGLSLIKKNDEIIHFGKEDDLESNKINDIYLDDLGVLWIATQKGFSIFKDNMFYNFGGNEKLRSSFTSRIVEDDNNQIWISGNKGVVRIDNTKSFTPITPPKLIVNQLKNTFELDVIDYSGKTTTIQYRSNKNEAWKAIESKTLDVNKYAIGAYNLQFRARNPNSDWEYSKEHFFQIKQKWYKKLWFIIGIAFIITTLTSSLIFLQLNAVRKRNRLLQETIAQSLKLEKELNTVRENVAQDFHDELGNKLAGITVMSEMMMKDKELQKSKSIDMIAQVRKDAKDLYFGIKDFVWSIDSKSDNLKELVFYLIDFGEDLFQNKGVVFKTKKQLPQEITRLPYYWSKQLLLLFKEVMTNSLKHANASEVTLSFGIDQNTLKIKFIDNGTGFDASKLKRKNGLINMENRAKKIGGKLSIHSKKGTIVIFEGNLS
ncbi:two-component regulator propeller domain-containing protein [Aquimarina sp. 2201CG5-10]|uniref:sensor histidine kinase n=1 Tax=Aquimarina callyspongiae TaxID=3098150 RepID=UPI002AB3430E|nr:two-component regulator propeller domain-containing protein [Aquimarina sp. 2201CG5-10]MDY8135155.1 hypothetical protein [Aquimarina sp. 2201CG5-10]